MDESGRFSNCTGSTAKLSPTSNERYISRGRVSSSSGRYSLPTAEVPPQKATPRTNNVGIGVGTRLNVPESLAHYLSSTPIRHDIAAGRHLSSPLEYRQFSATTGTSTSSSDAGIGLNSVSDLTRSDFNNEDFLARKELQQHQSLIESLAAKIHRIEEDVRGASNYVGVPAGGLHKVLYQNVDSLRGQMDSVIAAKNSELTQLHSKLSRTEHELDTERMLSAKDKLRSQLDLASREREIQQLRNQLSLLKEELRYSQEKCHQAEKILTKMKRERDKRRNFGVGDDQTDLSEREFLIRKVADLDQRVQNLSAPYMKSANSSYSCGICESAVARNSISMSDSFISQDKYNRMKNKYRFMVNQLQCQLEDVQTSKEQSSVHQELQNTELSALRKALNEAEKKNQLLLDQINAEVRSRDDEKILEEIKEAQGDIRQCQKAIDWLFSVSETLGKSEIPSVELMLELRSDSESTDSTGRYAAEKVDLGAETVALRLKVKLLTHRLTALQSFIVERFGKTAAQDVTCAIQ